ncbi:hypothetical protein A3J77_00255 [Candidatus Wolfebacteria bacterium RBG_13_41_7]|uniref:Uncharacterized protein n=1 Tax=Candidatus Wolfebacteria bacterium RBG_13_41_7 TaxID=1802554 RepID=A0A1F8DQJ7_9BACT|nr:MAG: hypothetical protein A3J77_00255 [Candidatus Wolfebacteria bacterium RBG_13_41_7]
MERKEMTMPGEKFVCEFRKRCGTPGKGCMPETATPLNCGFIATVEKEKKQARKATIELLERCSGVICFEAEPFRLIRDSAEHLTRNEFITIFSDAMKQYSAAERAKRGQDNYYFAR